jgi:hypothetical protein
VYLPRIQWNYASCTIHTTAAASGCGGPASGLEPPCLFQNVPTRAPPFVSNLCSFSGRTPSPAPPRRPRFAPRVSARASATSGRATRLLGGGCSSASSTHARLRSGAAAVFASPAWDWEGPCRSRSAMVRSRCLATCLMRAANFFSWCSVLATYRYSQGSETVPRSSDVICSAGRSCPRAAG